MGEVTVVFFLGLFIGSFLNVVIYRLPIMLQRRLERECAAVSKVSISETSLTGKEERFDLILPSSHCPACRAPIKPWHNIPILSYLWLKGRCAACGKPISLRYPLVEGLSACLSAYVALFFNGLPLIGALLLTWALIALVFIDLENLLLPDDITLPWLWFGLGFNLFETFVPLQEAVVGAMAGYLIFWSVYQLFKLLTGKEGMGYGDFKLLAMLGAWLGWQQLPFIILFASATGVLVGSLLLLTGRLKSGAPLPFGPFLALGGWIALLMGDEIIEGYLRWLGSASV